jgi:hypothetical protein
VSCAARLAAASALSNAFFAASRSRVAIVAEFRAGVEE